MSTRSTSTQPSTRPGQNSISNLPVPFPRARSIPQLRRPQPTAPPPLPGPIPLGLSRTQSQVPLPLPRPTTSSSSNTNSKPKPKLQNLSRKPSIPLRPTLPPPRSTITRKASSRVLGTPAIPAGAVSRKTSISRLAVGLVGSPAPTLGKGKKLLPARSLLNLGIGLPSRSKVKDAAGAGPAGRNGFKKDINPDSKMKMGITAPAVPSRPARVASRPQLRDDRVTQDQVTAPDSADEQTKAGLVGTDNVFYEADHHKNKIGAGIGMPMPIPPKEVSEARAGPIRRVISRGRGINRLNDLDMDYEQDEPMGATPSPTKRFELGTPILRPARALAPAPKDLHQYNYEVKPQHPDVDTGSSPQNISGHLKDSQSTSPLPAGLAQYQSQGQDRGLFRVKNTDGSLSQAVAYNRECDDESEVRHDTRALGHPRTQDNLQDSPTRPRIHSQPASTPLFPRLMARGQVINFDHLPMIADASFSFTGDSSEEMAGEELRIAELALERMRQERHDAILRENDLKGVIKDGRWKEVRGALELELERVGEFRGMLSDLKGLLGGMKV